MRIINPEKYTRLVTEAQSAEFSGWDFDWLEGRLIQEETPWDYRSMVRSRFDSMTSLLDMGTGGGELLASLTPLPPDTHATESYPPNQILARQRLSPLKVAVHNTEENAPLPFSDGQFDLVINRHESYDPAQVYRILKPDGFFITQQVGGLDNLELNQVFEKVFSASHITWGLAQALTGLYEAGFAVQQAEKAALTSIFMDIGAVVYYLKAIPWQIPGFTIESQQDGLISLHHIMEQQGQFTTTAHRFLISAQKKESL